MVSKVQKFISEVATEMKKVSWTTRPELIDSTLVVLASAIFLGVYIAGIDYLLSKGISVLIK